MISICRRHDRHVQCACPATRRFRFLLMAADVVLMARASDVQYSCRQLSSESRRILTTCLSLKPCTTTSNNITLSSTHARSSFEIAYTCPRRNGCWPAPVEWLSLLLRLRLWVDVSVDWFPVTVMTAIVRTYGDRHVARSAIKAASSTSSYRRIMLKARSTPLRVKERHVSRLGTLYYLTPLFTAACHKASQNQLNSQTMWTNSKNH